MKTENRRSELGKCDSDRDITGGELFKSKSRELVLKFWVNSYLLYWEIFFFVVACEYSRLSSLVATGDISRETCLGVRSMEGWLYSQIVLVGEKPEHQYLQKRHWRGKEIVRKHHKDIYLWVMYTFFYRTRDKFLLNPFNLASLSLLWAWWNLSPPPPPMMTLRRGTKDLAGSLHLTLF